MRAKDRHRKRLVEYLSNPNNDWPVRSRYGSDILGLNDNSGVVYHYFNSLEMSEIEKEALENRRKRYSSVLSAVDKALIAQALEGSVPAMKLCYQRFEGWTDKQKVEHQVNNVHSLDQQTQELILRLSERAGIPKNDS